MGQHEKQLQRMIEEARMLTRRWVASREYGFALPEIPGEFVRPEEAGVVMKDLLRGRDGEREPG